MRTIRVGWLMALTLVATTLPAGARTMPTRKVASTAAKAASPKPARPGKPAKDDGKSSKIKIAPNTELWDGSSTRAAGTSPGPVIIGALLANRACVRIGIPQALHHAAPEDARPVRPDHSPWLVGHYPHAPPASA